jgi:hypothetical protein
LMSLLTTTRPGTSIPELELYSYIL